jgi:hypothetical protein
LCYNQKKNFKDEKVSPSNHLVENAMNFVNKFEVKANENCVVIGKKLQG